MPFSYHFTAAEPPAFPILIIMQPPKTASPFLPILLIFLEKAFCLCIIEEVTVNHINEKLQFSLRRAAYCTFRGTLPLHETL